MDKDTKLPPGKIVPFPTGDRRKRAPDNENMIPESFDHGPSPEESLRIMRAFVGIKNRTIRANLIEMLEGASRIRGQATE
ncbi:MAG TPA: hypothetical protein VE909_10575 [Xanthobacteraceae bacterium]|nr:hypothetical protein [Xanthobacteraceae bacterium]